MIRRYNCLLLLLLLTLAVTVASGQKKPVGKSQGKSTGTSKTGTTKSTGGKSSQVKEWSSQTPTNFTPEQIETFRQQSSQLVKFFEGTLNFLGDKRNTVKEKEVIITQSYLKSFWDSKVQVEDDLDEKRLVPLYKDIPAYLTDVDFFFRGAVFRYEVQDVSVMTNEYGQTYFKVTTNRLLNARTVDGDTVSSNKVRYFEINYDDSNQQLKIVSIYTTKLNESADLQNWWNGLPEAWRTVLGNGLTIGAGYPLGEVTAMHDTVITVAGVDHPAAPRELFSVLLQMVGRKSIDLSGNSSITTADPLGKLSSLTEVNLAGTSVIDLMPLRNLNALEQLDISGTPVESLEPLRYANHLKSLKMKGVPINSLSLLSGFPNLETLDVSNTQAENLDPLRELTAMTDLRISGTKVASLDPIGAMTGLRILYLTGTPVTDLTPVEGCTGLQMIFLEQTVVKSLKPLEKIQTLQKVFCDKAPVPAADAVKFMLDHPSVLVIFKSEELTNWWAGMPAEWKKVFNLYTRVDDSPTTEQLHRLLVIDSVNIKGRMAIRSLDPLRVLAQLRFLDFGSTEVSETEPLRELAQLKTILANNTKIAGLEPLSKLDKLTELQAENTEIGDLMPLSGLSSLRMVYADNTRIEAENANRFMDAVPECLVVYQTFENTGWWNGLPEPWKKEMLKQIGEKGTPDKVALQRIAGLEKVVIQENTEITSLTPVAKLTRLKELTFSGSVVAGLGPLAGLRSITVLRIPKNPVTDLTPLSGLITLTELDFSNTQVEDLEAIQTLRNLKILKFSGTPVKSIKPLQFLAQLQVLEFYNTRVGNLDVLEPFSQLTSLKIFNTKISQKRVDKFKTTHPGCEVVFY